MHPSVLQSPVVICASAKCSSRGFASESSREVFSLSLLHDHAVFHQDMKHITSPELPITPRSRTYSTRGCLSLSSRWSTKILSSSFAALGAGFPVWLSLGDVLITRASPSNLKVTARQMIHEPFAVMCEGSKDNVRDGKIDAKRVDRFNLALYHCCHGSFRRCHGAVIGIGVHSFAISHSGSLPAMLLGSISTKPELVASSSLPVSLSLAASSSSLCLASSTQC